MSRLRVAAEELARREAVKADLDGIRTRSLARLSVRQRAFVLDESPTSLAVTSRQSGKTESLATKIGLRSIADKVHQLYVAPTRENARNAMWGRLKQWYEDNKIQVKTNEVHLEITVPATGSVSRLVGVPHKAQADRLRGTTLDALYIDEGAVYGSLLQYMLNDVLEPQLMVRNGKLSITSTPGLLMSGYFYELATGQRGGYSRHNWSIHDNPAIMQPDEYLRRKLADNGWTDQEAAYRREYLGQWCQDLNSGVYRVTPSDLYTERPPGDWSYVLGVDLGFVDEAAFSVLGWRTDDPVLYVVESVGHAELTVSDIAERIKELRDIYEPVHIVCDAGALGKTIVEELRRRHQLNIEAADKRDKPAMIRQVNSDLVKGQFFMPNGRLYEQMQNLRWHPDRIGIKEMDGIPNDLCFVAGTMITTKRGDVPIEEVTTTDYALTRHGFFPVEAANTTGIHPTYRVTTESGREIIGTAGHPVLTNRGWVPIGLLSCDDNLYACQNSETTTDKVNSDTEKYGNRSMDQFQPGCTSITSTATTGTTLSITCPASQQQNTCPTTPPSHIDSQWRERILSLLLPRHQSGTDQKQGENGIATTQEMSLLRDNPSIAYALCVEPALSQRSHLLQFVQENAVPRNAETQDLMTLVASVLSAMQDSQPAGLATPSVVQDRVVSVVRTGERATVYNLTVQTAHEYFANGLLVSNCDATLYAFKKCWHYIEKIRKPQTPPGTEQWLREEAARLMERKREEVESSENEWAEPSWEKQYDEPGW